MVLQLTLQQVSLLNVFQYFLDLRNYDLTITLLLLLHIQYCPVFNWELAWVNKTYLSQSKERRSNESTSHVHYYYYIIHNELLLQSLLFLLVKTGGIIYSLWHLDSFFLRIIKIALITHYYFTSFRRRICVSTNNQEAWRS